MAKNDFVVKYTNKDIMDKLDCIESKISAQKTNVFWLKVLIFGNFSFTAIVLSIVVSKF